MGARGRGREEPIPWPGTPCPLPSPSMAFHGARGVLPARTWYPNDLCSTVFHFPSMVHCCLLPRKYLSYFKSTDFKAKIMNLITLKWRIYDQLRVFWIASTGRCQTGRKLPRNNMPQLSCTKLFSSHSLILKWEGKGGIIIPSAFVTRARVRKRCPMFLGLIKVHFIVLQCTLLWLKSVERLCFCFLA